MRTRVLLSMGLVCALGMSGAVAERMTINGYLLGSLPFALVVARRHGVPDLRQVGDRNPGYWNACELLGPQVGVFDDAVTQNIDIAPTLLEASGLKVPASMQGRSLWPLLTGRHDQGAVMDAAVHVGTLIAVWPPRQPARAKGR